MRALDLRGEQGLLAYIGVEEKRRVGQDAGNPLISKPLIKVSVPHAPTKFQPGGILDERYPPLSQSPAQAGNLISGDALGGRPR